PCPVQRPTTATAISTDDDVNFALAPCRPLPIAIRRPLLCLCRPPQLAPAPAHHHAPSPIPLAAARRLLFAHPVRHPPTPARAIRVGQRHSPPSAVCASALNVWPSVLAPGSSWHQSPTPLLPPAPSSTPVSRQSPLTPPTSKPTGHTNGTQLLPPWPVLFVDCRRLACRAAYQQPDPT
ncbi:unnamed protein product, partial [Tilletia controversa]